jgi:hypothetical protein
MAENEIEIEVVLNAKSAEEGLERIQEGGEAVGETFKGVGATVAEMGGEVNERFGAVGETMGGVVDSVSGLSDAVKGSQGSFLALLGPIGLVTVALVEAVNALREYFNLNEKRQIRIKAYEASTSELTTAIEELASQQVKLNAAQVDELRVLSEKAKIPIETAQLIRERNVARREAIEITKEDIKFQEQMIQTQIKRGGLLMADRLLPGLEKRQKKLAKQQAELAAREAKAVALTVEGQNSFMVFEKRKQELEKTGLKAKKELAKVEGAILTNARVNELKAQKQTADTKIQIAIEESNARIEAIKKTEDVSADVIAKGIQAEQRLLERQIVDISDAENAATLARSQKADALRKVEAAKRKAAAAQAIARAKQTQAELARIEQAQIENQRILGASKLDVLKHQEALALKLAGDNANAQTAIQMEFENRRLSIQQEAEEKRIDAAKEAAEKERELEDKRRAFILESTEFDLNAQQDGIDKELALLDLRYQREMELRGRSEEEITELTRRHNIERNRMLEENAKQGYTALNSTLDEMGEGLQRGFGRSIFDSFTRVRMESKEAMAGLSDDFEKEKKRIQESGEGVAYINQQMTELQANYARERANIRKSEEGAGSRMVGELLMALGQQAAVEALMFSAKGTAALFTNPAAAGGYFTASAIMGVAAVTAGASGSSLLSGGGGGGGGSIAPDSTPTDSPTTAPSPERAQADSSAMVFNINFGNSTIYDTKRAAQDAMADNIIRTINRQRRGAPRFAMG